MTEWHSGPPPSIGWWQTKLDGLPDYDRLRWWDGAKWSQAARPDDSAAEADWYARCPTDYSTREIKWSARPDSWPERSKT
jgi:hypothetical protein